MAVGMHTRPPTKLSFVGAFSSSNWVIYRPMNNSAGSKRTSSKRTQARATSTEAGADRPRLPQARSVQRQQERRQRVHTAPARMARSFVTLPQKINPLATVISIVLVIFLALSIATPLRNYFEQRAEIARLDEKIHAQEQRKNELTDELNRYNNEDYIKEQARTRLGLIEPGESAYRIISPRIKSTAPGEGVNGDDEKQQGEREWYQKLWDSLSVPEPTEEQIQQEQQQNHLPTIPDPNQPKPDQGQQPPQQQQPAPPAAPAPAQP